MIIGFTGTRLGMTNIQLRAVRGKLTLRPDGLRGCYEFHHGDCVGADLQAHLTAADLGYVTHAHPMIGTQFRAFTKANVIHPPRKPLDRNQDIVNVCELLIAAPSGNVELKRSGTWATIRRARKAGRHLIIVFPDGLSWEEQPEKS